ncbi:Protein phosphatase 1H [Trichoplax sp. H2]|nr:Protein phosphatase 1H [Trichoplax sp. H2]|eukprot:RDD41712.1 Protein phosphatase 1H [Trichoplax sp. H2]
MDSIEYFSSKVSLYRPEFLRLTEEDLQKSKDRTCREIISPSYSYRALQDSLSKCINSGKSHLNEDQAAVGIYMLRLQTSLKLQSLSNKNLSRILPYQYFAIFDGHGGTEAAIYAANSLHLIIYQKLTEAHNFYATLPSINSELSTDQQIGNERQSCSISGGCTAIMALYFEKHLYVANAGDCRALIIKQGIMEQLSTDFNPITDRQRLQYLAYLQPELLHAYYNRLYFKQRIRKTDVGKPVVYKDMDMVGWGTKIASEEDFELVPMIRGGGKQCRLLDIISTTRGFGDFDLKCQEGGPYLKPFLTSCPEVKSLALDQDSYGPDDILILGCDGLYESLSNEEIGKIVLDCLQKCGREDNFRYAKAAKTLVETCRGMYDGRHWMKNDVELASQDDISAFIIPLINEDHLMEIKEANNSTVETCRGMYDGRHWMKNEVELASQDDISAFIIPLINEDHLMEIKEANNSTGINH